MGTASRESRPVTRRPGGRSARVRRAVFDATLALLLEGGYPAVNVETVAARAGVNKTTVYRNWPTRAALVRAAAEERSEGMIRTEVTGHPERDLTAFLQSVVASVTSPVGRALVIATLSEPETARSAANRAGFWRHRFDAAADLIRSVAGEEANADEVIEQLIAPVFLRAFITGAPIDRELIEKTVRAALRPPTHNTEVNDESARSR